MSKQYEQSNEELIKFIKQEVDTQENLEKLYNQNIRFIHLVIRNRVHGIYEYDDLLQSSFIALVKAVELFDPERDQINFLTLLKYCILNELRKDNRLSAHMINKIMKYKKVYHSLYNELGRKPKNHELMYELDIDLNQLEEIRQAYQINYTLSLDEPISEEGGTTRLDLYAGSKGENDEEEYNLKQYEIRQAIEEALSRLPDEDSEIIEKRYFEDITLKQIGEELQITPERVRRLEGKALWKMRRDPKFVKRVFDYTEISNYVNIGICSFNRNHTSSTEEAVLRREKLRERLLKQS